MQTQDIRLGFLGFGEVGYYYGKGLTAAGVRGILAYSRSGAAAGPDDPIRRKAAEAGVELVASAKDIAKRCNVIIAMTPGKASLKALKTVRSSLKNMPLYVDVSSGSIKDMEQAGRLLEGRADFVDAAIMGPVPPAGITVPLVAAGPNAGRFADLFNQLGMKIKVVSDRPGAASAMKLIRSVTTKGVAAALLESLEAAYRHGILEAAIDDIATSFNAVPFEKTMKRYVCGTTVHAGRRIGEMSEVLALLKQLGAPNRMTKATKANLQELTALGLREHFNGEEPDDIRTAIEAVVAAKKQRGY